MKRLEYVLILLLYLNLTDGAQETTYLQVHLNLNELITNKTEGLNNEISN